MIPTSNHNFFSLRVCFCWLYIFWFLHQTTTVNWWGIHLFRCISFDSYIKPQLNEGKCIAYICCISFDSYIKPQLSAKPSALVPVVYLLIPTSNHNYCWVCHVSIVLYIFWFLHQTTTPSAAIFGVLSCISFDSYIKPQLEPTLILQNRVVYLMIPTSNHNLGIHEGDRREVVYLLIPTSNHNSIVTKLSLNQLYIFWFLHQTTTSVGQSLLLPRCISFDSYIKPQREARGEASHHRCISFDSYIKPQLMMQHSRKERVVYLLIPTSNHNPITPGASVTLVVYLLIPTSNHNL